MTLNKSQRLPLDMDPLVWQYEHLRQMCIDLNGLLLALMDVCTRESCPEMSADDLVFSCAAHTPTPKSCCAIDYMIHTLDKTISSLLNTKSFPSRNTIPESSLKEMHNLAKRLYRIFAHTCFVHKEVWIEFETLTSLYARFLSLTTEEFDMIPLSSIRFSSLLSNTLAKE